MRARVTALAAGNGAPREADAQESRMGSGWLPIAAAALMASCSSCFATDSKGVQIALSSGAHKVMQGDPIPVVLRFRNSGPADVSIENFVECGVSRTCWFDVVANGEHETDWRIPCIGLPRHITVPKRGACSVTLWLPPMGIPGVRVLTEPGIYRLSASVRVQCDTPIRSNEVIITVQQRTGEFGFSEESLRLLCHRMGCAGSVRTWPSEKSSPIAEAALSAFEALPGTAALGGAHDRARWLTLGVLSVKATALALAKELGSGQGTHDVAYKDKRYTDARFALYAVLDKSRCLTQREDVLFWGALLCVYARELEKAEEYSKALLRDFPASVYGKDAKAILEDIRRGPPPGWNPR